MKKLILLLPILLIFGCSPNETVIPEHPESEINIEEIKEQLKEEIKEEVKEEIKEENKAEEEAKAKEITIENYDYKTDPDTLVVQINNENFDEYFDMRIIKGNDGRYIVCSHSLMYDKGYVAVGTENCDLILRLPDMEDSPIGSNVFSFQMPYFYKTEEEAEKLLEKIDDYDISFMYEDATIYYQKIEDVKFGYDTTNGYRIVNGKETYMIPNNPY